MNIRRLSVILISCLVAPIAVPSQSPAPEAARPQRPARSQFAPALPAGGGLPSRVTQEREHNDSIAWADDITNAGVVDGTISSANDRDVYRLDLAADSVVSVVMTPGFGVPIDDPDLMLTDAIGHFAGWDAETGLYPSFSVLRPRGTVYLHVTGFQALRLGSYRLDVTIVPRSIPTLLANTTTPGMITVADPNPTWRLMVPVESRIHLTSSGVPLDLFATIARATGSGLIGVDNGPLGSDPDIDTTLPAGEYLVSLSASAGVGSFTFRVDLAPQSVTALPCPGSLPGSSQGSDTHEMFRVTLAAQSRLEVALSPRGLNPMTFGLVELFDAALSATIENLNLVTGGNFLDTTLPPGNYLVRVTGFSPGDYTISTRCTPMPALPPLAFGSSLHSITLSDTQPAFALRLGTPNPFELTLRSAPGFHLRILALDANGIVRGGALDYVFSRNAAWTSAHLGAGDYVVVVADGATSPTRIALDVQPPMFFRERVLDRRLVTVDKAGREAFVLVALQPAAQPVPLSPPFVGNLLIDFSTYVFLNYRTIPPGGEVQWPEDFGPYSVAVQGVVIEHAPFTGFLTDLVR